MNAPKPSSLTIEEAVARMVSLEYLPEGFTVQEMTAAFLEDAKDRHDGAGAGERESLAIRANVCEARHRLAQALIQAMECELDRGDDSALDSSIDSAGIKRVTTESLSQWASDQFGVCAPEWEPWNFNPVPEGIRWENVKIKIYTGYRLGVFLGDDEYRKSSFQDIGLMGKRKHWPNGLGKILLGLSDGVKYPKGKVAAGKDKKALSDLRRAIERLTGIASDPFYRINEGDGWLPRFKLIDDRRNADERAKVNGRDQEESYDETLHGAEAPDYEAEGDDTDEWIKNHQND